MPIISIGQHVINRLKEIGIDTVFGVPGDFNMPLLDIIEDDEDLTFGSNANELNAAYAADGYARVRGAGALVTTFGVGELSAINGIAGSYSENVPVIHIVGAPRLAQQRAHLLLHHTLGNGDYQVFFKIASMVTKASATLTLKDAASEIDRVIQTAFVCKRPGYLGIPVDLINSLIEVSAHPLQLQVPKNPEKIQSIVLQNILNELQVAKHPAIMVDGCIIRYGLEVEANAFIEKSGFPTFSTPIGKGAVNCELDNYRGVYCGKLSLDGIQEEIEKIDLLIELGPFKTDFNTGNFSYGMEKVKTIQFHSTGTVIDYAEYPGVCMQELLPLLTLALPKNKEPTHLVPRVRPSSTEVNGTEITHNYFWKKVQGYIEPNSIVISEAGTAVFSLFNMEATKGTTYISQILWCSIGYSVGAALGAGMADRNRRVYLFVGDGSFQLTAQEVSVFIRKGLTPVIFLLNNDGYLTEKLINGPYRDYNNIPMWEYSNSLKYFGGYLETNKTNGKKPTEIGVEAKVSTPQEFEDAMKIVSKQPFKIHFLEVVMPQFDAPKELQILASDLKG
ncbi:pyruvate decarboxylase PdcB [Thamnidium elegans]|nr:pyruvate decarboxylase PdcB [Thamnidium elegans]